MKIIKICPICNIEFKYFRSDNRKYCSMTCYHKSPTRGTRPKNRRKEHCTECCKPFERPVSNFQAKKRHFCCKGCSDKWNIKHSPKGKGHPSWRGGYSSAYRLGWNNAKRIVKKRADNKCEICREVNKKMDVHHKIPIRTGIDIKIINHPDNLLYLCRPCHAKEESVLRQKEEAAS